MRTSHLALAATFALVACTEPLASPAAPADALGAPNMAKVAAGTDVVRFNVTFSIPGGTCGLASTVTGTGVYQVVTRETQGPSGELRLSLTETSHGTATGADGSRYRYNYSANYTVVDPSTFPLVLDLVDHFNLLGQGGAPDVRVYLRGQFQYDGTLPLTPVGTPVIRGDLACDPI